MLLLLLCLIAVLVCSVAATTAPTVEQLFAELTFSEEAQPMSFWLANSTDDVECPFDHQDIAEIPPSGTFFHASTTSRSCQQPCQIDSATNPLDTLLCSHHNNETHLLCPTGRVSSAANGSSSSCSEHCPAGYFCWTGSSRVYECAEGTCCAAGTQLPVVCGPGQYCPRGWALGCDADTLACPVGHYCPDGRSKLACTGNAVQNSTGQTTCHDCQPGQAPSSLSHTDCASCGPHGYSSNTNYTTCEPCPANRSCASGQVAKCPLFHYCQNGTSTPCPAKYYCNEENLGTYEESLCPAGKYCNRVPTELPIVCPADRTCDKGTAVPKTCALGEYMQLVVDAMASYYTCADCFPGRYCQGGADLPQVCAAPGWCASSRTCLFGSNCAIIDRASPRCTEPSNAICDRAFEVRAGGRIDSIGTASVTVTLDGSFSQKLLLDANHTRAVQVIATTIDTQLWIDCSNEVPLRGVVYRGGGAGKLLLTNCRVDASSIALLTTNGPMLVVLGSGVLLEPEGLNFSASVAARTTILMRTGAALTSSSVPPAFQYIKDLDPSPSTGGGGDSTSPPTQPPAANGGSSGNQDGEGGGGTGATTVAAIAIAMVSVSLVALTLIKRQISSWYRKRRLSHAVIPGRRPDEYHEQQQQREQIEDHRRQSATTAVPATSSALVPAAAAAAGDDDAPV